MSDFPPHGDSDTSFEAALSVAEITGRLRILVYEAIKRCWRAPFGATCDELEVLLGMRHQTCSARIWELHRRQFIRKSGIRRPTRAGRMAIVWVPTWSEWEGWKC